MQNLSEEQIFQIPKLYVELKTKKAVAEFLGITTNKLNTLIKNYNLELEKKEIISEETIKKINELYSEYKNMAQVGRELGLSSTTIKKYLTPENLELNKINYDDRDALWYYIIHLFGVYNEEHPVDPWNMTQMQKFRKQGINYKAQLLTLKWYYEIEKHPVKDEYHTIGIIPYIVEKASYYYKKEEKKRKQMEEGIKKQLEQDRIQIKYNPKDYIGKRKKKQTIDLNQIKGENE